ncbi:hypothetical protein IEQ44_15195 [Nocardioides sp. Y6]|uniref:Uncharacterized protein n=1 Tax=Nocardioides malaquae TaxID=2773426 RepID=A0ABR9RWR2_9ACTN|nr:hypothetical protein [Nocardioides malaquae]MBE7325994.1 hypothetical protein [Nocardioides malaquae]
MGHLDVVFEHPDEGSSHAERAHETVRRIIDRAAGLCTVCGQPGSPAQDQRRFWLDVRCHKHSLGDVEPTPVRFTTP